MQNYNHRLSALVMPARPASFFPAAFGVRRLAGSLLLVSVLAATSVSAQDWAPQPVTALDGRFTLRGDATVTVGGDDTGYFNYTDYDHSTLHLVRFDATAALRAGEHVTFLTELRAEGDSVHGEWLGAVYAAFVRTGRGRRGPSTCRQDECRRHLARIRLARTEQTTC